MAEQINPTSPLKSVAVALVFSVLLGPIGLLYASVWGGTMMILFAIMVISSKFTFSLILIWLGSCVWSVAAVEKYNRTILNKPLQQ